MNKQQLAMLEVMDTDRQRWWRVSEVWKNSNDTVLQDGAYANMHRLLDEQLVKKMCSSKVPGAKKRNIAGRPPSVYQITQKGTGSKIREGSKERLSLVDLSLVDPSTA